MPQAGRGACHGSPGHFSSPVVSRSTARAASAATSGPAEIAREDRMDHQLFATAAASDASSSCCASAADARSPRTFLRRAAGVEFARERVAPDSCCSADEVCAHCRTSSNRASTYGGCRPVQRLQPATASRCRPRRGLLLSPEARGRRPAPPPQHQHLDAYASHAAWLEDHCAESNGRLADRLLRQALAAPVSRTWKGFWQRRAA